jgi:glycosyltransferase involved in cell wall biosynthesis
MSGKETLEDKELPLVTVFTLIYNTNPTYIIEAIESVRANEYPNIQHIIIDDCSPDSLPKEQVKAWIQKENYHCEFYEHEINFGISRTINHVLELAKGEFLIGCCDDVLLSNRISADVNFFLNYSEIDLIHSKAELIDGESKSIGKVVPNSNQINRFENYFNCLLFSNFIVAPTVSLRVKTIKKLGGYSDKFKIDDYEMWLRMSGFGCGFYFRDEVTTQYRIHSDSFTSANWRLMFNEDVKIKILYTNKSNTKSRRNILKMLRDQVKHNITNDDIMPCFEEYNKKFGFSIWILLLKNHFFQFIFRSLNRVRLKTKSNIRFYNNFFARG